MAVLETGASFGPFRVEEEAGRGGMGVVYRAHDVQLDRRVALKVIDPARLDDPDARRRFLRETRAAAAIEHPNVVPIYAAGETEGVAYMAMRFVDGEDLRRRVRRDGALAPVEAVSVVSQVAAALEAAHAAGLVHRDVKPANVLLGDHGHVYLTDFGIAGGAAMTTVTAVGQWVGSSDFVAPEQIRGGPVDARTDVYALGALLFYVLTGRPPFVRDGEEARLWAHLHAVPPAPSRERAPPAFDSVVARAMAKNPDDRYAGAGELARAANDALEGRSVALAAGRPKPGSAQAGAAPDSSHRRQQRLPPGSGAASAWSDRHPSASGAASGGSDRRRKRRSRAAVATVGRSDRRLKRRSPRAIAETDGSRPRRPPAASAAPSGRASRWTARLRLAALSAALLALGGSAGIVLGDSSGDDAGDARPEQVTTTRTVTETVAARPPSGPKTASVQIGRRPVALLATGSHVWLASTAGSRLDRVDARTMTPTKNPPGIGVGASDIVEYRNVLWAAAMGRRAVLRLHPRTGRPLAPAIPTDGEPRVLASGIGSIWVALRGRTEDRLMRLDAGTAAVTAVRTLPEGVSDMQYATGILWVLGRLQPKLMKFDPMTLERGRAIAVGDDPRRMDLTRRYVWVSNHGDDSVARVDRKGGEVSTISTCNKPYGIDERDGVVWVACFGDHAVARVSARTRHPFGGLIRVGINPVGLGTTRDAVWVTGGGDDSLWRIDRRRSPRSTAAGASG